MADETLRCLEIQKGTGGHPVAAVVRRSLPSLAEGEVLIRVAWSSLNYKDALATTGHPGVVKRLPLVPGIDAAGEVVESQSPTFRPGEPVIATSYDLGVSRDGGWSEFMSVPAEWVIPLPGGLELEASMQLGTAGLTAGLCVEALQQHGLTPEDGEILVTGATGGVGSLAVRLLAHLGYRVVAVTGKGTMSDALRGWGASEVLPRNSLDDVSTKPLLAPRWSGVVDCVGGLTLANAIRQTRPGGCVAACGLVGGTDLPLTIYPFILRGITLVGIDSAYCPYDKRYAVWQKLAAGWKFANLADGVTIASLDTLPVLVARMLRGELAGRVVVSLR